MMKKVHLFFADAGKVVFSFDFHRFCFNPTTVFPVAAVGADFADVDFRIEIGRKRISVIAAVAVKNVNGMNFVKNMFLRISRKNAGDAGIKSASQNGAETSFFEFFSIRPLILVFEFSCIFWFIVGSIDIMSSGFQTGVHNRQILIRQRQIQNNIGFEIFH